MAYYIGENGIRDIAIPAGEKIAVWSPGQVKLYSKSGYPNYPNTWALFETTTVGEEFVSDAFTYATTVKVESLGQTVYYEVAAAPTISSPLADQSFADATGVIAGLAAAQGGSATLKGGTSSTAANAGGAAAILGGQAGAEGVGGAATVTGAAGGATSGAGGAATVTGGAGTAGNSAGGAATVTGGSGQGTAAGGAASLVAGASGAGATGNGGDASVTAGAAASTNGNGGDVILTPGALAGTGLNGGIFTRGHTFFKCGNVSAEADGNQAIAAADMINGIVVHTVTTGRTLTTPTGAAITAACPAALAAGDAFLLHVITVGTGADDISTLTAGDGDVTFVGNVTVGPDASTFNGYGTWVFRYSGTNAWVGYRVG